MLEWQAPYIRIAGYVQRLPYSEDLEAAYRNIALAYAFNNDYERAWQWLQVLEARAAQHHDQRGLARAHFTAGLLSMDPGDWQAALSELQEALDHSARIGDPTPRGWTLSWMGC